MEVWSDTIVILEISKTVNMIADLAHGNTSYLAESKFHALVTLPCSL